MQQDTIMYRNYYIASFFFKCIRNECKYLHSTTGMISIIYVTDESIFPLWKLFGKLLIRIMISSTQILIKSIDEMPILSFPPSLHLKRNKQAILNVFEYIKVCHVILSLIAYHISCLYFILVLYGLGIFLRNDRVSMKYT